MTRSPFDFGPCRAQRAARGLATFAIGAALALCSLQAAAQSVPAAYRGLDGSGLGEGTVGRRVDLSIGRSLVVDLPRDAKEVFVANPAVANAVVRSTRKVFLIGIANGATSVFVMDNDGRQIASLEVNVGRDLSVLRQTLRSALPTAQIDIKPAGNSILMTGSVASAGEAQQASDIASAFVGQGGANAAGAAGSTGASGAAAFSGGVINVLTIRGRDQVMLKVTVAEVSRNVLKQFGVSTTGNWSTNNIFPAGFPAAPNSFTNPSAFPISGTPANSFTGSFQSGGFSMSATLSAFERAGLMRTLAEPNLTAISGEAAKFLVGGEVPISTISCSSSGGGTGGTGTAVCQPTVTFKPFGVTLNFTPVVMSEGRISIRLGTEVSEIDTTLSVSSGSGSNPGFRVRRSETTVEMPSGGVLMSAGLLQQSTRQSIGGFPGIQSIPILGTLFRSRDYQRQETELVILVSPYIVKPMEPNQAARPDDGFVDAQDTQSILLGRLNKIYGVAGAPGAVKPRGNFGFITD